MTYVAMTRFFNRTLIEVNRSWVAARHAPLPWPGGKRFATDDVRGLHVEIRRIHAKSASIDECWNLIVRPNGKKAVLLKGLEIVGGADELHRCRDERLSEGADYCRSPVNERTRRFRR